MPTKDVRTVKLKPQRGKRPGVRGPAMTVQEQEASKVIVVAESHDRVWDTSGLRRGNPGNDPTQAGKRRLKIAKQLADLIREIGDEIVDPGKGWTRIEAVIRRMYSDALSGKPAAQALLLERGWGKVPTPVQLDMRTEVLNLMNSTGLTIEELEQDPVLKQIVGKVIDGEILNAPR